MMNIMYIYFFYDIHMNDQKKINITIMIIVNPI